MELTIQECAKRGHLSPSSSSSAARISLKSREIAFASCCSLYKEICRNCY
jgi:hypothetical protein